MRTKWALLGLALGLCYWLLESAIDWFPSCKSQLVETT